MKNLPGYMATLFMIIILNKSVNAQRYDDFYRATDADVLLVEGNIRIEHTLRGATIMLPNGSNQLRVTINIPYSAVDNKPVDDAEFLSPGYYFQLKVNIDPGQIQEVLTSAKTFLTQGFLTLNSITKPVVVSYIPIISETKEDGNFNIYLDIQFNAVDFNLGNSNSNTQLVFKINNAKVNRI